MTRRPGAENERTDLPTWLTVGADVVVRTGGGVWGVTYSPPITITRITATQIVLADGSKWRARDLTKVAGRSGRYWADLVSPDDPEIARDTRMREKKAAAFGVQDLGPKWANNSTEENAQALRDAIVRLAPHLGLTVTMDAADTTGEG